MRRLLALPLVLAACAPPQDGDSCQRAAGFLQECGVSLPLLGDGACVGLRLEVADCVLSFADDCRQVAELPAHMQDCLADLGDDDPDLPDLPPPSGPPPATQPESGGAACADGSDNDGDAYIDCDDFDCSREVAVTVCPHEVDDAACADGSDNDGDSYIDCDDFDCQVPEVSVCG